MQSYEPVFIEFAEELSSLSFPSSGSLSGTRVEQVRVEQVLPIFIFFLTLAETPHSEAALIAIFRPLKQWHPLQNHLSRNGYGRTSMYGSGE